MSATSKQQLRWGVIPVTSAGLWRMAPTAGALRQLGLSLWPHTYCGASSDTEAWERLVTYAQRDAAHTAELRLITQQICLLGSARWADQGFPQIVVGHRYAAALMATSVPTEMASMIRPPWPAFLLEVPQPLLPMTEYRHGAVREIQVQRVLVQRVVSPTAAGGMGEAWQYVAFSGGTSSLYKHGMTMELMLREQVRDSKEATSKWEDDPFWMPTGDVDHATIVLLGRLIAGVCLAMSDPNNVTTRDGNGGVGSVPPMSRDAQLRTYKVGKPVTVDVRPALDAFIHGRGTGTSPTVQTVVRGHWKPRLAEKVGYPVWVEPYMRGPDGAPVLVRPMHLQEP